MTTLLEVRQDNLLSLGDGNTPAAPLARMGIPAQLSKWDLFALGGRMFTAKQTTIGTALAGSAADAAGVVLTAPTFRFTVPAGTTVFPRRFDLGLVNTGVDNELAVIYTSTDTYTSGGTAITPLNFRTDNSRSTAVTNCYHAAGSAIVEAALVGVRALYQRVIPLAAVFATNYTLQYNESVQWDDLHPIIGPASLLIFLSAKTTANTHYFSLEWAKVDTVNVKAGVRLTGAGGLRLARPVMHAFGLYRYARIWP